MKLRNARQATEARADMMAKLRPRKSASHYGLRPRRKVVYVFSDESDEDADETTHDSDEPYVQRTKTKTKPKTRKQCWKKKTTLTKMRTRGSRRPIEVELTYYGNPSDRKRAIKVWGCKMPAPDRKQATQRHVYAGKLVDGFEVIGTYSDYRIKAMRTLDQPATAYRSNGRPYVARRGAKRKNTGTLLDIGLGLMSFDEKDNLKAFEVIREGGAFKRRKKRHAALPLHQPGLSLSVGVPVPAGGHEGAQGRGQVRRRILRLRRGAQRRRRSRARRGRSDVAQGENLRGVPDLRGVP